LVSAPAGYGKSSLVSSWLEDEKIPNCWISLDGTESDLRSFLEYVVHSVNDLFPGKLGITDLILQSPEMPPIKGLTSTLLNELDEIDEDFVLVLDDYHNIQNQEIHGFIDGLLQFPPEKLHLFIITRKDPSIRIGKLRAYSRLCEIRMTDLAFDATEISVLYNNLLSFKIREEISKKLFEITEGWVMGLRLMAYSVQSPEHLEKILYEMKGSSLHVTEYLINEVLADQPENIQELLLKSSLLGRFCSELLEILITPSKSSKKPHPSGTDILEWLENTNMFLISLDDEHRWYRYHALFREILLKRAKEKFSQEQLNILNKKICKWFEDNNLIEKALNHAMELRDFELAADIVERSSAQALEGDEWLRLERWLGMLPSDVIDQRARLLVSMAWIGKINFNFNQLAVSLNKCQVVLGEHPEKSPLYGEICCLLGYMRLFVDTDVKKGIEFIKTAMKLIPESNYGTLRAETEMQFVLLLHCAGKSEEAIDYALNKLYKLNPDRQRIWERLQIGLCNVYLLGADLIHCYSYAKQMREITEKKGNLYAGVWSRWFMGASSFYRFELNEAIEHFDWIVQKRFAVFNHAVIDSIYALAVIYQMQGDEGKADETVAIMEEYVNWTKRPSHNTLLGSLKARLELMRGNTVEAVTWQRSFHVVVVLPTIGFFIGARTITECASLAAEGTESSLKAASEKIKKMLDVAKVLNYKGIQIELLILQSIVYYKQRRERNAVNVMKQAVEIAESGSWVFPFIEHGEDAMRIMELLIKEKVHSPYCERLKEAYHKHKELLKTKNYSRLAGGKTEIEPLSNRETEILTLLSYGFKNKEIGEKIFLAPTTIKKHVYNIYQKLNVHSRIQLVERAKELNIIPK
jgi:LuxR family maltose regulon positive regulatory protein